MPYLHGETEGRQHTHIPALRTVYGAHLILRLGGSGRRKATMTLPRHDAHTAPGRVIGRGRAEKAPGPSQGGSPLDPLDFMLYGPQ